MLRTLFLIALASAIAIAGGAASAWYALETERSVGAVEIGPWTAYPDLGSPDADPYSKARIAREGALALGRGEGVVFTAARESSGAALRRDCDYSVGGTLSPARLWTLYAANGALDPIPTGRIRRIGLSSQELLRQDDSSVSIAVSRHAMSGNWLAVSGDGPMQLILTLYDSPAAGAAGLSDVALPFINRVRCDG